MVLTNHQLVEEGIITNVTEECMGAPSGIDLQVESISKLVGVGFIPREGKTQLPHYEKLDWGEDNVITLSPGTYDVMFSQGCKLPANVVGKVTHRSSVLRCGCTLTSGIFDNGFETSNIGSFITVVQPIRIEKGARLAQINCCRTEKDGDLYDGQWMFDQQRQSQ